MLFNTLSPLFVPDKQKVGEVARKMSVVWSNRADDPLSPADAAPTPGVIKKRDRSVLFN